VANKYPYVASAGPLLRAVEHLRKSFPKEVTAETLRKLGIAPKNESYVINILRFLGVVDEDGRKVDERSKAFFQDKDEAFAAEFGLIVKEAYAELFELHGDAAWGLDRSSLTQFFRTSDHSSDVVGSRQAGTFSALAALSGHRQIATSSEGGSAKKSSKTAKATKKGDTGSKSKVSEPNKPNESASIGHQQVGLTVRIEVNLPADGDQDTYDKIFKSIRENLLNAK